MELSGNIRCRCWVVTVQVQNMLNAGLTEEQIQDPEFVGKFFLRLWENSGKGRYCCSDCMMKGGDVMVRNKDGGITTSSVSVAEQILQVLNNNDLSNLSDSDRLLCERIQHDLMRNDDQKYLSMHKGKISRGKDGRLVTNVHVPSGAYITVRGRDRNSEDIDVLNKEIIRAYKEDINQPRFIPVFNEWLDNHLAEGQIRKATYTRYKTHAKRFFDKDSTFCKTPLVKMTDKILTD